MYLNAKWMHIKGADDDSIKDNKERENVVCGKIKSCIFIALHNSLMFTWK